MFSVHIIYQCYSFTNINSTPYGGTPSSQAKIHTERKKKKEASLTEMKNQLGSTL